MTQEKANKIFETELGQQINVIYVTSDDQPFIRYDEALYYIKEMKKIRVNFDNLITDWYSE